MPNSITGDSSVKFDPGDDPVGRSLPGECALVKSEVVHDLLGLKILFLFLPKRLEC